MLRLDRALLILGALLFCFASCLLYFTRPPVEQFVLDAGGCRLPVSALNREGNRRVTTVVFHGLFANRRLMMPAAEALASRGELRVYVVDLPGHGDNAAPMAFSRVEECAARAVQAILKREQTPQERTILVGHSMGGAVAIRLASRFPNTLATIALAPAPFELPPWAPSVILPFPPPHNLPHNLLLLVAEYDLPLAGGAAQRLIAGAGGERSARTDIEHGRGMRFAIVPRSAHTSMMFAEDTWEEIDRWLNATLQLPEGTHVVGRASAFAFWLGLVGLVLLCPALASLLGRVFRSPRKANPASAPGGHVLLRWAVAGVLAIVALSFGIPLRILHGSYFESFVLIAGVVLLALLWDRARNAGPLRNALGLDDGRAIGMGALFGLAIMLGFGAWLNLTIFDAWLNAARWMRFVPAVLICFPYALAEEWELGNPPTEWRANARRYIQFFTLRFILWFTLLLGIFAFASGQILLLLLAVYMTFFSLGQRMCADAIRRRTGSAGAAAATSAILGAWFVALFPLA